MRQTAEKIFQETCISEKNILEVENLCVSYERQKSGLFEKKEKMQVLHDVSFFIRKGEVLGLVGESGCGKSTLSRAILGLLPDYEGTIRCAAGMPQMVFQDPSSAFNPKMKIKDIICEPLLNFKMISGKEKDAEGRLRFAARYGNTMAVRAWAEELLSRQNQPAPCVQEYKQEKTGEMNDGNDTE